MVILTPVLGRTSVLHKGMHTKWEHLRKVASLFVRRLHQNPSWTSHVLGWPTLKSNGDCVTPIGGNSDEISTKQMKGNSSRQMSLFCDFETILVYIARSRIQRDPVY